MQAQRIPNVQQNDRIQRDRAARYDAIQHSADRTVAELDALLGRTGGAHHTALREVMAAGERAAHLSRGYTPEQPSQAQELRPIQRMILALWVAFGAGAWATYLYFALAVGQ